MLRRSFLTLAAAAAVAPAARSQQCQKILPQVSRCTSQIDLQKVVSSYNDQKKSQWCWAASTSMIFAHAGFDLSQPTIVKSVYGDLSNQPAYSTSQMAGLLSRTWTSDTGKKFKSRILAAYNGYSGDKSLNNDIIRTELNAGRPLFYCNRSHAMVLTAFVYDVGPGGMVGVNLGFADPWPGNGLRGPKGWKELNPMHAGGDITYIAAVHVTAA